MRSINRYNVQFLGLIILSLTVLGCSNAYVEDIKRGAGYNYKPGFPELRLEVAGVIDPDTGPEINVAGNIPYNSLVFKSADNKLAAIIKISYELTNETTNKVVTFDQTEVITKSQESSAFEDEDFLFKKSFESIPGQYTVNVTVQDLNSQKLTLRTASAYLPDPDGSTSNITNIQILTKQDNSNGQFFPVTTYDVSNTADSIKFQFQVSNKMDGGPLVFNSRLIRFASDTTEAQPMSFTNKSASSLEYKGIDYDEFEVIQSSVRELNQNGNVNIEFAFEDLERGNYRFEVAPNLVEKGPLYKARDFSIKSANYPLVKNARELAAPLTYLMKKDEHEKLMSIRSDDSLKQAIDRFWLENIQNSALAKNVISLFYARVEEANKFFSNFKEGWKTDMGMIYILFGPPLDEYKRLRGVRWSYKYNQTDPEYTFYFRSTKTKTEHYPFDNFILQRDNAYFRSEYRIRERWLNGSIVNKSI